MKVKYYFLTVIILMLLSFNSFALTDAECLSRPRFLHPPVDALNVRPPNAASMSPYFLYQGCFYSPFTKGDGDQTVYWSADFADTNQPIVDNSGDGSKPNSTSSNDADSVGTGTGTGSGSSSSTDSPIFTDLTDSQGSPSGDSSSSDSSGSGSSSEGASSAETSPEPIPPTDISGILTPYSEPVPVPEVIVNNSNIREVVDSFKRCSKISHDMPRPDNSHYNPFVTTAYNSVVDSCNAIYDEMSSLLQANEINSPLDDNHDFYTKEEGGIVIHCQRNGKNSGLYKLSKLNYPNSCDVLSNGSTRCSFNLNINYFSGSDSSYRDKICTDVYSAFSSSGDANESNDNASVDATSGADTKPTDSSVVNPTVDKGQGSGNISGDFTPPNPATGDNADVVNAINSFHYDANSKSDRLSNQISNNQGKLLDKLDSNNKELINELKNNNEHNDNKDVIDAMNNNHHELMDSINKVPDAIDYDGKEGDFKTNIDGEMGGLADSVAELFDEGTSFLSDALDNIDKLIPDIKLSFDLPPAIQRGSLGRCIPIVLDFDIELVGIPNYHFHGEAVQACELYDKYIRPVLDFIMVIITFFTVRGLLVRSAEFVTDSKI